ncbi:MAG: glycosyltransferase, partial [Candidatus Uhrbacteria bacterium]|nr:glycosyltransferase [Candidatus Uhrbacteria bacterium]
MKIALLTNAFGPPGGAGRIAELQTDILKNAGHEVRVFRPDTAWLRWPAPIRLLRHLADLFSHREMVDKIIAWHPDVLLTHNLTGCGFGTPSVVQDAKSKEQRAVTWVHVLHDVQLFEPSGRLRASEPVTNWQKLWSGMRRSFFRSPNLVISPTQWLLDQHKRRGWFEGARCEVLANPAPEIVFAMRAPGETLRLLFVGGTKEKGAGIVSRLASRTPYRITTVMN